MRKLAIIKAHLAARRFMECTKPVLNQYGEDDYITVGTKETAALKRASMDLTRALAEMRKT